MLSGVGIKLLRSTGVKAHGLARVASEETDLPKDIGVTWQVEGRTGRPISLSDGAADLSCRASPSRTCGKNISENVSLRMESLPSEDLLLVKKI
jgi:hypothetical protein